MNLKTPLDVHRHLIIVLDFGSQYSQLIVRRVRELGVYCLLYPYDIDISVLKQKQPAGIILSGGPATVTKTATPRVNEEVFKVGCPVLGICYGMQAMAAQLGGQVAMASEREFGRALVNIETNSRLLKNITGDNKEHDNALLEVWMSHGDQVTEMPEGFACIASSKNAKIAGIADEKRHFYGLQFHPEVTHTVQGKQIFQRFLIDICQCQAVWTVGNIIEQEIENIREQVGSDNVVLGLSGGVDSTVVALLLERAIGDQLTCLFVDTGLLRTDEAKQVMAIAKQFNVHVLQIDAQQQFYQSLDGISDPEEKRKRIGQLFVEIFEREANKLQDVKWLAQGTIYPDVIESAAATDKAAVIKSHHNVGGLPEKMSLKLLEPLRELFKDEVRQLGTELGLPREMVYRHPFPGPGLAVRIAGEVKVDYLERLRQADLIFIEELHRHDLYYQVAQAFAVFVPVKTVGVVGDVRQYDYVIALRAVKTIDFMTADWARLPHDFLAELSNRIINEVSGISRVVYDISSKPPATIEWE